MNGYGWKAHLADDFLADGRRLFLHAKRGDVISLLTSFDEYGNGIMEEVAEGAVPEFPGFHFPNEALEALAEVLKPGPTQEQLDELRASLDYERTRVDRMLAAFLGIEP